MCVCIYTYKHTYIYTYTHTHIHMCLSGKSPAIVNITRTVCVTFWHWCNLAAKESGLECTCMNNDNFTVLVSGSGKCHWVSMCTVWPSHSIWLSKQSNESASNFVLSLNIPPQKLLRWFRRPQLRETGDWQLHHNNTPTYASHLMQSFGAKHQITQVTQPPTAQIWCPAASGFSQN